MKILLLALICFASTQVYGSDLEDRIQEAIEVLEVFYTVAKTHADTAQDDLNSFKTLITARPPMFIQQVNTFKNDALDEVKTVAKNLTARAKEGKLPQEVIKCIAKEEQATISAISPHAPKFETDIKAFSKQKLPLLEEQEKKLKKIGASLPERYKKGVADLKSCKDASSVTKTMNAFLDEFEVATEECKEIEIRGKAVQYDFDRNTIVLSEKSKFYMRLTKNVGIVRMSECFPKTA